ncbi:hypothetical protein CO038_03655 [Candidatus Pacearchaeota archaeon CG_4_9_14_0_2_um_filter_39_13]|nr:MAG: hypothetical protein CO038_03655 [Candidatus Pacearchaeota archaeon CG_4_9_14_0_2_um_filter_39_13]
MGLKRYLRKVVTSSGARGRILREIESEIQELDRDSKDSEVRYDVLEKRRDQLDRLGGNCFQALSWYAHEYISPFNYQ